jgi:hypothetical protein
LFTQLIKIKLVLPYRQKLFGILRREKGSCYEIFSSGIVYPYDRSRDSGYDVFHGKIRNMVGLRFFKFTFFEHINVLLSGGHNEGDGRGHTFT